MAVLDAPPGAVRPAGGEAPRPARLPRVLDGRFLVPFSLGAAALSLLVVRSPTYDVWAWLVWGREIAHLDLDTSHGPEFKPLPVAVAATSSALGDSGIVLVWMVLARAGAVLAVGAVARVAWRAAGPGAAVLASLSLITVHLSRSTSPPTG